MDTLEMAEVEILQNTAAMIIVGHGMKEKEFGHLEIGDQASIPTMEKENEIQKMIIVFHNKDQIIILIMMAVPLEEMMTHTMGHHLTLVPTRGTGRDKGKPEVEVTTPK